MEELFEQHQFEPKPQPPPYSGYQWKGKLEGNVATERKGVLIEACLRLFLYITKRATYIDAFAGPQDLENPKPWAARRLWQNDPGKRKFRIERFELFEQHKRSLQMLQEMAGSVPENGREIHITPGDCNENLPHALEMRPPKTPTFCLLDQRTTECKWKLLEQITRHKIKGHKIELFYFVMAGWKNRSLKNLKSDQPLIDWWGRDDPELAIQAKPERLAELLTDRFHRELGYAYVKAFPIYAESRVNYWMIHASDHSEAIDLMRRAYNLLGQGLDPDNRQDEFEFLRKLDAIKKSITRNHSKASAGRVGEKAKSAVKRQ